MNVKVYNQLKVDTKNDRSRFRAWIDRFQGQKKSDLQRRSLASCTVICAVAHPFCFIPLIRTSATSQ